MKSGQSCFMMVKPSLVLGKTEQQHACIGGDATVRTSARKRLRFSRYSPDTDLSKSRQRAWRGCAFGRLAEGLCEFLYPIKNETSGLMHPFPALVDPSDLVTTVAPSPHLLTLPPVKTPQRSTAYQLRKPFRSAAPPSTAVPSPPPPPHAHNSAHWLRDREAPVFCASDFSGIGALEFGLQAGFRQAGFTLKVQQASELCSSSHGRHCAAVLRARFPGIAVLDQEERTRVPLPPAARLVVATPICTEHSPLKHHWDPTHTESLLRPLFNRLASAPHVVVVLLENVPEFVSVLDGQKRSTYSFWVEGLQGVGFTHHAFGLFHSGASGDLHDRQRLLSVHSRTPCFSPAAALGSLLSPDEGNAPRSHSAQRAQHQLPVHDLWVQCDECAKWRVLPHGSSAEHLAGERWVCALHSDERYSRCDTVEEDQVEEDQVSAERRVAQEDSFSFTIGTGADRAALHGVRPAYGRIRPYNRNLDTAIFFRGVYYYVGQWLAHRASGLPETYQRSACITLQRAALGHMVGPLLARDLGYAVATEWSCPMQQRRPDPTPSMPLRPGRSHWRRGLPASFPRSGASGAVLAFTCASTGEWRAVRGRSWRFAAPPVRLDELCAPALARGDLTPLGGGRECDLRRVAADVSLSEYARHCARRQLVGLGLSPLPIHERLTVRQWAHHAPRSSAPVVCSRAERERRVPGATLCKGTRVLTLPEGAASPLIARVERLHSNATVTLRGDDGEARRLPVGAVSRLSQSELSPVVDIPATWEMPLTEDAQNEEGPIVDKVLRHVLYRGASPGSLYNVYVRLQFSDGGRTTYYLPAESIADTNVLMQYARTAQGHSLMKYLPRIGFPMVQATSAPRETWIACDRCGKWRHVGLRAQNQLGGDEWNCADNPDRRYAWCEVPQELADDEIDIILSV